MAGQRKLEVIISGDAKGLDRAIGSAQKSVGGLDTKVGGFSKNASLGLAAVGVGALAMGKSFVDAASESQKVTKQTEAVLKSMGNAAGVTAGDIANLSDRLSKQSGIDDELIQSGQNVLLTFGNVRNEVGKGNDVFNRASQAALDMSVALGTDLSSANIQLGKALNDPIKGLATLSRAGVSFTEQQKEQIRTMVASGDTLGAQKVILSELDKQFAGSAEAQATASDKLKVAWGNLQEQIGSALLPAFESIASMGSKVVGFFADLPDPVQSFATKAAVAGAAALTLGGSISFTVSHLRNMKENLGGLIPSFTNATGALSKFGTFGIAAGVAGLATLANSMHGASVDVEEFAKALASTDDATEQQLMGVIKTAAEWSSLGGVVEKVSDQNVVAGQRMVDLAAKAGITGPALKSLQDIVDSKRGADELGAASQGRYTAEIEKARLESDGLTASLEEVANQLRAQFDPLFGAQDAVLRLKEAQDAAAAATRDHGAGSAEAAAANRDAVQAALGYETQLFNLKHAVETGDVELSEAVGTLNRWAEQGWITGDAAGQAANEFGRMVREADRADGKNVTMTVTVLTNHVNRGIRSAEEKVLGSIPGRAAGGPVHAGQTYLVGEKGPELLHTGGASGTIVPNDELRSNPGSGGLQITVDARGAIGLSESEVERWIVRSINTAQQHGFRIKPVP